MFLAGDVGGTKTHLAFFEKDGGRLRLVAEARYPSRDHPGIAPILRAFLAAHPLPAERVCLGVAGPVRRGRVETPNLPWVIDADHLMDELRLGPVSLLNDLEVIALGKLLLDPDLSLDQVVNGFKVARDYPLFLSLTIPAIWGALRVIDWFTWRLRD